MPKTANDEPRRAKLRIDKELPTCPKQNTDIAAPKREKDLIDIALPRLM
jgi:hypothetical protein